MNKIKPTVNVGWQNHGRKKRHRRQTVVKPSIPNETMWQQCQHSPKQLRCMCYRSTFKFPGHKTTKVLLLACSSPPSLRSPSIFSNSVGQRNKREEESGRILTNI